MYVAPHHSPPELQGHARKQTKARPRLRIQAVILAQRGHTAKAISDTLDIPLRTIESWIHRYNKNGLSGLEDQPRSGRKCRLCESQKSQLQVRLDAGARAEDEVCSLRGLDIQLILKEEFGASYSLNGVYHLLHQLGYSSLVPRPQHHKADPAAQEAFKKTCETICGNAKSKTKS
jgi:transposase